MYVGIISSAANINSIRRRCGFFSVFKATSMRLLPFLFTLRFPVITKERSSRIYFWNSVKLADSTAVAAGSGWRQRRC